MMTTVAMSRKDRYMASLAAANVAAASPAGDEPPAAPPPNSRKANYIRAKLAGSLGKPAAGASAVAAAVGAPKVGDVITFNSWQSFGGRADPMKRTESGKVIKVYRDGTVELADNKGTVAIRDITSIKPAASAGQMRDDGTGSIPAKHWFGKQPAPGQKPAAPPEPTKPKAAASAMPVAADGAGKTSLFITREQYDSLIGTPWIKQNWPKVKTQWSIGGVTVYAPMAIIQQLKKMVGDEVGASTISAGSNIDKQAAVQAKLKAKGFILGTGKPSAFGYGGAIPYRREWAPNMLVLAKLSDPLTDFKPTTQAEVAKLIGMEDQLRAPKASVAAAASPGGVQRELPINILQNMARDGKLEYSTDPKVGSQIEVKWPNGKREWIMVRPAKGTGASVSAATDDPPVWTVFSVQTGKAVSKPVTRAIAEKIVKQLQRTGGTYEIKRGTGASVSAAAPQTDLRSTLKSLDANQYASIRNSYYKAVEGLAGLAYALRDVPALKTEQSIASQAQSIMSKSQLGKFI